MCALWVFEKLTMWTHFGALHMFFRNLGLMSIVFTFNLAYLLISFNYSGKIGANLLM